jgi:hypothetical protein
VDAALAPDAPGLTPEALRKRAWRLTLKLEPDAAARRKKKAKRNRRVEMWMEESGNAGFAGRELDPEDALAANAYYDAVAKLLRKAGIPGTLRELRYLAFVDRNTGKDPLDRIKDLNGEPAAPGRPKGPHGSDALDDDGTWRPEDLRDDGYRDDEPPGGWDTLDDDDGHGENEADGGDNGPDGRGPGGQPGPAGSGSPSGGAAAPGGPALNIHLLVPAGTVLGWSDEPGDLDRLGPVDAPSVRDLVRSGARNPATRWHVTLIDKSGQAVAHACARGPRSWPGPLATAEQEAQVSELLKHLGIATFEPIARGGCDHRHREDRYRPSRTLGDLVRARSATCPAPGCGAQAIHNDLDHTTPWPDGPGTCECNLSGPCRHHHRMKQAPGWRLAQPGTDPGFMRWTTPSGRVYETRPTTYNL